MPTSFDFGDFFIWDTVNEEYVPFTGVHELSAISDELDVTIASDSIPLMRSDFEIVGTLIINKRQIKRIAFGWTAKGPVRVRALNKAYDLRRKHAEH
jgi:hypothetical protein